MTSQYWQKAAMIWKYYCGKSKKKTAKARLHLVIKKTNVIMTAEELHYLNVDNEDIEMVKYVVYFGLIINSKRCYNQEIRRLGQRALKGPGKKISSVRMFCQRPKPRPAIWWHSWLLCTDVNVGHNMKRPALLANTFMLGKRTSLYGKRNTRYEMNWCHKGSHRLEFSRAEHGCERTGSQGWQSLQKSAFLLHFSSASRY